MANIEITIDTPPYLNKEFILVNAMQFTGQEDDDFIYQCVCEISDWLVANNKTKVAFNIISEGMPYNQISTSQKIIKELIEYRSGDHRNFALVFGATPCIENLQYYKLHCKRFDWIEVTAFFVNWWEYYYRFKILEKNSIYSTIDTTPKIKSKKFLCYNRQTKPHRLYITTQCIKRDLIKESYFSNYFRFPEDEMNFGSTFEWFPTLYEEIHDLMYQYKNMFPLDLGLASLPQEQHNAKFMNVTDDVKYFEDSYFGVVTESKYIHDNYNIPNQIYGQLSLDGYVYTEKTYRFIASKKPIILAAFTGSLKILRDFGYKTFHPYIDETYDTIENDEERIIAIVNEIERLAKMSDEEWMEWQRNVEPIVLHNYNKLLNSGEIILTYNPNP